MSNFDRVALSSSGAGEGDLALGPTLTEPSSTNPNLPTVEMQKKDESPSTAVPPRTGTLTASQPTNQEPQVGQESLAPHNPTENEIKPPKPLQDEGPTVQPAIPSQPSAIPAVRPAGQPTQLVAGKFQVTSVTTSVAPSGAAAAVMKTLELARKGPSEAAGGLAGNAQVAAVVITAGTVTTAAVQVVKETQPPETEARDGDDSEDEGKDSKSQVVETSPCGRYHKRRERVQQREVPGIDAAFLAMDTDEGKEVVWNEVQFSEKKNFKDKEEQIHQIFDNLINLHHPSILKFHRWWTDIDVNSDKPRVIFITEHISSGSLHHFIKTSKHSTASASSSVSSTSVAASASSTATTHNTTHMPEKSWKRWGRQILTALNYLHTAKPPIVHGNLNLDTVFLQHNGLIKIGCVAPDAIHQHVRTCREHINIRNLHFVAPEYAFETLMTPAADIYSFGVLALEMWIYGIHPLLVREKEKEREREMASAQSAAQSGETPSPAPVQSPPVLPQASLYPITPELLSSTLETLENGPVKSMIRDCLQPIPEMRPSSRNLLFHPAFFEVPPLKQIAAFAFVDYFSDHLDNWNDLAVSLGKDMTGESVIAEIPRNKTVFRVSQLQNGDLDKYLEDIRQGVYPLTATGIRRWWFGMDSPTTSLMTTPAQSTRDEGESYGLGDEFEEDFVNEVETRLIMSCMCTVRSKYDSPVASLELILRMEDKMNRHLVCDFDEENDSSDSLAEELLEYGLINDQDQDKMSNLVEATMRTNRSRKNEHIMNGFVNGDKNVPLVNGMERDDLGDACSVISGHVFSNRPPGSQLTSGEITWDVVVRSPVTTFNAVPAAPQTVPTVTNVTVSVNTANGPSPSGLTVSVGVATLTDGHAALPNGHAA